MKYTDASLTQPYQNNVLVAARLLAALETSEAHRS